MKKNQGSGYFSVPRHRKQARRHPSNQENTLARRDGTGWAAAAGWSAAATVAPAWWFVAAAAPAAAAAAAAWLFAAVAAADETWQSHCFKPGNVHTYTIYKN